MNFAGVKIKKSKVQINPAFLIIFFWLVFATSSFVALNYFIVTLLHELGHYFVAKWCGYKLSKFSLSPYGVGLSYYGQSIDEKDETWIALSGPLVNIFSSVIMFAVWWLFPASYFLTYQFVEISLIVGLSNLLPAYPLDGGRIFIALTSRSINPKIAYKITFFINFLLIFLCFLLFIIFCFVNFNPTYLLFGVFLIMGILDLNFISKYDKINIFNKDFKDLSKPNIFVVHPSTQLKNLLKKIQANKTSLFIVILNGETKMLSDKEILELTLKFDLNEEIGKILFDFKNCNKNYENLIKNLNF